MAKNLLMLPVEARTVRIQRETSLTKNARESESSRGGTAPGHYEAGGRQQQQGDLAQRGNREAEAALGWVGDIGLHVDDAADDPDQPDRRRDQRHLREIVR